MPFVKAGNLSALPPGELMHAEIEGRQYAICNVAGELHVLDGICPHLGGPLGHGALHDDILVCPWHAWEYDCRSGENTWDPGTKLQKFPVRIDGDAILIEVP